MYPINIVQNENSLDIYAGERLLTSYVYDTSFAKPYLGPVYLSNGKSVTRLDLTAKEHPHQRSIFAAVGDVSANGVDNVDFWNEYGNYGYERPDALIVGENGFAAKNIWQSRDGVPMLDESRSYTFICEEGKTVIVNKIRFTASYGDVVFGATKEAGPLGIRVADEMRGDRGGLITDSEGRKTEAECWSRSAAWCRYSGSVDGLACSITVEDDPSNERYPTAWHVRDYGLFAANNLYFKGGLTIPAGQSLTYKFTITIEENK